MFLSREWKEKERKKGREGPAKVQNAKVQNESLTGPPPPPLRCLFTAQFITSVWGVMSLTQSGWWCAELSLVQTPSAPAGLR